MTADKMLGTIPEPVDGTDSQFTSLCYNAINTGSGLQSYQFGTTLKTLAYIPTSMGGFGEDKSYAVGIYSSSEVVLMAYNKFRVNINLMPYMTGHSTYVNNYYLNQPIGVYPWQSSVSATYIQLYNYNKLAKVVVPDGRYVDPALDLTLISYPTVNGAAMSVISSTVWQNRLFVLDANGYLAYSAAGNYENFTSSATEGGIIKLQATKAFRVVSTDDMVYIFTDDGVYALYGSFEPAEWSLTKISNEAVDVYRPAVIKTPDNSVYFISIRNNLIKITSGAVTRVCRVPRLLTITLNGLSFNNRYLGFHASTAGNFALGSSVFVYDTLLNCWSIITGVSGIGRDEVACAEKWINDNVSDGVFTRTSVNSYIYNTDVRNESARGDMLTDIRTDYQTLDGSTATKKHIKRIEFDILWNTRQNADGLKTFESDNKYYTELMENYAIFASKSTLSASYLTVSAVCSKINKTISRTFYDIPSSYTVQPAVLRTFTLNNTGLGTAINSVKFEVKGYGHVNLKAIRVYYEPAGNYKNAGSY